MGIQFYLWEETSFLLSIANLIFTIDPPTATNATPTTLIRASDAVGESLRVSRVLSCGICCSQAL